MMSKLRGKLSMISWTIFFDEINLNECQKHPPLTLKSLFIFLKNLKSNTYCMYFS